MKLVTYACRGVPTVGVFLEDRILNLRKALTDRDGCPPSAAADMLTFLKAGASALDAARAAVRRAQDGPDDEHELFDPLDPSTLMAPVPHPGKMLCLAGNYAAHIEEGGGSFDGKERMIPRFFMKPCTAIIGHEAPIRIPPSTPFADWELELAVVIGKSGRDLSPEQAQNLIAGYTIFNDISARELTFRKNLPPRDGDAFFDWQVGKWLDSFGPMGPFLTTCDEVPHPDRLAMRLWHNGELRQDANSGQMIFSPAEALSFISQFVTLEPGDVLSTGTPAGVGRTSRIHLNPGDRIRGEIEGLGTLENPVAAL